MASVTHQKFDTKVEVYNLLKKYTDILDADERRKFALALSEALMAKMTLPELTDWLARLKRNQGEWGKG